VVVASFVSEKITSAEIAAQDNVAANAMDDIILASVILPRQLKAQPARKTKSVKMQSMRKG